MNGVWVYGGVETFGWVNVPADYFKVLHDGSLVLYEYLGGAGLDEATEAYAPGSWSRVSKAHESDAK